MKKSYMFFLVPLLVLFSCKDTTEKQTQKIIKKTGIPSGLWDTYREKYNWKFTIQFYKEVSGNFTDRPQPKVTLTNNAIKW